MNGPAVTLDLLQRCVAAGVPDGGGAVFAAGHQQSPGGVQSDGVHLRRWRRKGRSLFFFFNAKKVCILLGGSIGLPAHPGIVLQLCQQFELASLVSGGTGSGALPHLPN